MRLSQGLTVGAMAVRADESRAFDAEVAEGTITRHTRPGAIIMGPRLVGVRFTDPAV